jgi:hypothetical protein
MQGRPAHLNDHFVLLSIRDDRDDIRRERFSIKRDAPNPPADPGRVADLDPVYAVS